MSNILSTYLIETILLRLKALKKSIEVVFELLLYVLNVLLHSIRLCCFFAPDKLDRYGTFETFDGSFFLCRKIDNL